MLMTPILKSYCMVIPHILTKTFSPKKHPKPEFKLKNETFKVPPFFANLSKIDLYVMKNPDPPSEN